MIRKFSLTLAGAAVLFAAPVFAQSTKDIVKSGAIGAGGGAVVGAIIPGLSVGEGALIGGVGGAVVGALKKHKYYRDNQGRRYWLDKNGRRRYK